MSLVHSGRGAHLCIRVQWFSSAGVVLFCHFHTRNRSHADIHKSTASVCRDLITRCLLEMACQHGGWAAEAAALSPLCRSRAISLSSYMVMYALQHGVG